MKSVRFVWDKDTLPIWITVAMICFLATLAITETINAFDAWLESLPTNPAESPDFTARYELTEEQFIQLTRDIKVYRAMPKHPQLIVEATVYFWNNYHYNINAI